MDFLYNWKKMVYEVWNLLQTTSLYGSQKNIFPTGALYKHIYIFNKVVIFCSSNHNWLSGWKTDLITSKIQIYFTVGTYNLI